MMMMLASVKRGPDVMAAIVPRSPANVNAEVPLRTLVAVHNHVDERWTTKVFLGMSGQCGG
jgi:hypothetical protein